MTERRRTDVDVVDLDVGTRHERLNPVDATAVAKCAPPSRLYRSLKYFSNESFYVSVGCRSLPLCKLHDHGTERERPHGPLRPDYSPTARAERARLAVRPYRQSRRASCEYVMGKYGVARHVTPHARHLPYRSSVHRTGRLTAASRLRRFQRGGQRASGSSKYAV